MRISPADCAKLDALRREMKAEDAAASLQLHYAARYAAQVLRRIEYAAELRASLIASGIIRVAA